MDGISFVKLSFEGQSFMLHQIRKMVGAVVFIVRYSASEKFIPLSLTRTEFNISMAPAEFLTLDSVNDCGSCNLSKARFEAYNNKLTQLKSPLERLDMNNIKVCRQNHLIFANLLPLGTKRIQREIYLPCYSKS